MMMFTRPSTGGCGGLTTVIMFIAMLFSNNVAIAQASGNMTDNQTEPLPIRYGVLLFQAFQLLDVFGPIDVLAVLSKTYKMDLALISVESNLDPVTIAPQRAIMNPKNSSFFPSIVPTHTLKTAPELDVLIVPGGIGTLAPDLNGTVDYIRATYPKLQYILSVCTGARLLARAGVLDGKNATTNKVAFDRVAPLATEANWVRQARWVADGNVWTSSGVSAGIDATLAFIGEVYGESIATTIATALEYNRVEDPDNDPFAELRNVTGSETVPSRG